MPVTELEAGKKEFEYATDNSNVTRFNRPHTQKNNYSRQVLNGQLDTLYSQLKATELNSQQQI